MNQALHTNEQITALLNNIRLNSSSTSTIIMDTDFFAATITNAFEAGAFWVLYNTRINSSSEDYILRGVSEMKNEISSLSRRIAEIDKKYDEKHDRIVDKLDIITDKLSKLAAEVAVLNTHCKNIESKVDEVREKQSSRKDWWLKHILPPIISGILVGLVLFFAEKNFL